MALSAMTVFHIAAIFFGLSTPEADAAVNAAIAKRFKVDWSSVQYSKNVVVRNPKVASPQEEVTKSLWLSCEVEISDPNLVLGTSRECVVTQLVDGRGQKAKVIAPPRMRRQSYEGLRYDERFAQSPKVPRWRAYLRSLLKLPRNTNLRPQWVTELRPSQFRIQLDKELLEQDNAEIDRLKGYFHALVAESYVHVDVPFEPNDNWISLTSGVAIRVREAFCNGSSYRFRIEASPQGGLMRPIEVDGSLPNRIVMGREFIGKDGKPVGRSHMFSHLPGPIGGSGSGSGSNRWVETIRFTIAVMPAHHKIPFELEHIPLPDPEP